MTDDRTPSSDEFDRIVEGLDLDLSGLGDLDSAAATVAAERERAALEAEKQVDDEPEDDQFYRAVGPAGLRADSRTKLAWVVLATGPVVLLLSALLSLRPPMALTGVLILASVAAVVYLVARLPDRGPGTPDWPDDGAAL